MAKQYLETCLLGMSAPPAEPGEAPPAAAGCQGGRPRACPPAAWSQHPDSIALEAWPRRPHGRRLVPAGSAKTNPAFRPGGLAGFWACPRRGWVSLSGSRMPPSSRDTGPEQGPRHSACPVHDMRPEGGPGPGRALGTSTAFSLPGPEFHTVALLCKCSERWGPDGVKRGPLMFITKQPAS